MLHNINKLLYISILLLSLSCNKELVQEIDNNDTSGIYPSDIIPELTKWKLTLPVDANGFDSSNATDFEHRNTNPLEIIGQQLFNFEYQPYFYAENNEIIFKAHCAGATTTGSHYPRSELRQLVGGGNNFWKMNDYQFLEVILSVTHTPVERPNVCIVQIHGPEKEPLRVHYDGNKGLYLVWNHDNHIYLKDSLHYQIGQKLKVSVTVNNGYITCTLLNIDNNEDYTYKWLSMDTTGYFKTGCYIQSSIFLSEIKDGYDNEQANAYGEVHLFSLKLKETYKNR